MQQARSRFDQLGNLQTALVLTFVLLAMLAAAAGLLAGAAARLPAASTPEPSSAPPPAVQSRPAPLPRPEIAQPPRLRAVTVAPSVNLRAEPTTAAETIAALPRHTEVELLGDDEVAGTAVWRHVRTDDGREGWIIGTALVLEPA